MNARILLTSVVSLLFCASLSGASKAIELKSPDQNLKVSVNIGKQITYNVTAGGTILLQDNVLALKVGKESLGENAILLKKKISSVSDIVTPDVPIKFSTVKDEYNLLRMDFKGNWSIEFRAYDEGIAYRFITARKGDIEVTGETFEINFPSSYHLHLQETKSFVTAYEERYSHTDSDKWADDGRFSTLPVLIETNNGYDILISESDLSEYPGMFLGNKGSKGMNGLFPKEPISFVPEGDRAMRITKEADYIAKTEGSRDFPWRYFVIADKSEKIAENTMTLKLAHKSVIGDASWIKPGQVSWEWWNGATPYGPDVDFITGCNLDTYKYFIDFASKYGIEYILMDEGWAKTTYDPFTPNPDVDLHELIRYGQQKNVGIVLWLTWTSVENHMDLFKTFADWGVKGVKIDFMNRSDKWMVNYYEKVAAEAAKNHLFVDFHGAFKPAGLEYKYPNVLSYEGVRGMEQMGGCVPDNSVYFPLMRNAVGPMDYTPGAMLSYQSNDYRADRPNSGSIGTRAYQMALFVVFESGLQMLADNPTLYYANDDCTRFIADVPTTWDETRCLASEIGEYVIMAKRKGDKWYIGGMNNSMADQAEEQYVREGRNGAPDQVMTRIVKPDVTREVKVKVDFLPEGKDCTMISYEDGVNAGRQAMHYVKNRRGLKNGDTITVTMHRNGGFAAVIE